MAERLADVTVQIENVRQLEAVVTAMRGIAASRAQRGQSMLHSARAYTAIIAAAIGEVLNLLPAEAPAGRSASKNRPALILFCAEQGFAGAFSERVLDAAGDIEDTLCLLVGTRGASVAAERGLTPAWTTAMVSHVDAVPSLAGRLGDALYRLIAGGTTTAVDILYPYAAAFGAIPIERRSLLPIDFSRFVRPVAEQRPITNLMPEVLLGRLADEYIRAAICEAAMHAFEAENEARMAAMTSAQSNIDTKLNELRALERQLRQEQITTEIVELAAGAEALANAARQKSG